MGPPGPPPPGLPGRGGGLPGPLGRGRGFDRVPHGPEAGQGNGLTWGQAPQGGYMLLPRLQHSGLIAAGVSVERKSVFAGPVPLHRPSSGLLLSGRG